MHKCAHSKRVLEIRRVPFQERSRGHPIPDLPQFLPSRKLAIQVQRPARSWSFKALPVNRRPKFLYLLPSFFQEFCKEKPVPFAWYSAGGLPNRCRLCKARLSHAQEVCDSHDPFAGQPVTFHGCAWELGSSPWVCLPTAVAVDHAWHVPMRTLDVVP